ncbi:MAG: glycosyltransferase family 4 protein [Planctomycetes bacterium]|nr:glycosyltransferase family 4 protein [Planctomycetota bacterium]
MQGANLDNEDVTSKPGAKTDHVLVNGAPKPLLIAYGWPREHYPNGVISYTAEIASGMQRIGAKPAVAAFHVATGASDAFVSEIQPSYKRYSRLPRIAFGILSRIFPRWTAARSRGDSLLNTIRHLADNQQIEICEIEEAFGTPAILVPRSSVPIVVRLHGPWFLNGVAVGVEQNGEFWKRVKDEGAAIAAAHGVTAPSQSVLDDVRAFYSLSLDDAEVIPNPVSPVDDEDKWNLRHCDRDRVLFVGRFDRHKGGDVMIDAMAGIKPHRPNCRLDFAGPDPGLVDPKGNRTQLGEYISNRLGDVLNNECVNQLGMQPADRLRTLRRSASVTVVCSRYENFPMAALEAMALGCPVVGTNVGGIPEIIQHERNGLLCRPDDPQDLCEKILTLLENPQLAERLGHQAALDVQDRYHPDVIAQKTLDYYDRVLMRIQGRSRPQGDHSR